MTSVKITQVNEKEIKVDDSLVILDDDNIIHDIAHGPSTLDVALGIEESVLKFAQRLPQKANMFVDLNDAGQPSKEARDVYIRLSKNETIGKIAIFGLHPLAKMLAFFVMRRPDMRFFSNKEKAFAWLKQ